ncbi:FAD-dependent oxidoreductase [Chloroflexota bacterium]
MPELEGLGEVISTDVLIVGGGIAGLVAALKAKEYPVDVVIVDKQTVGWAGHAPKIGGGLSFVGPGDDPDKFVEFQVRNVGHYLNDQELLYAYARESYGAAQQLAEWGANFPRDANSKMQTVRHRGGLWSGTGVDIDMLLPLRARARKLGVKILNKVAVVELLKQGNRVSEQSVSTSSIEASTFLKPKPRYWPTADVPKMPGDFLSPAPVTASLPPIGPGPR